MKRVLSALCIGLLVGCLLPRIHVRFPSTAMAQPRGDPYGARAVLSLEQAFKATGVLTFPNYAAAPVTCNAANRGVYYYDTVLTEAYICGAAGWLAVGGSLTVGTANTIPKWNAVPDDLVDTYLTEGAVPAAGAGGSILVQTTALNAMDGNDTIDLVEIILTNADHTGVNNILKGIDLWGIISDDQASEYGISVGTGWDASIWGETAVLTLGSTLDYISFLDQTFGVVFAFDLEHDPTASHQWMTLVANSDIMTGDGFTERGIYVALTNANHTNAGGLGNTVYGIDIEDITGDAEATEAAIHIGSGFDIGLLIETTLVTATVHLAGGATQWVDFDGILVFSEEPFNQTRILVLDEPAATASGTYVEVPAPPNIMNGADTVNMFEVDTANVNHTGAGNALNLIRTDDIAGDANANLNAIYIGALTPTVGAAGELEVAVNVQAGWDAAFYHAGIAHGNLVAANNGSIVFCTDCDPASTPCTAVGAQTGAFAFRVSGQWDCPW